VIERVEHVMGMPVRVVVRDAGCDPAAIDSVFAWLRFVDAMFSTYRPGSEISRLGRGELALANAHPLVREVLARCEELRIETRGAFDARAPLRGRVDPSGYVKGWAVERAVARLSAAGARDLCVDAGGDVCVRGGPWRVGIRHPRRRDRVAAVLELRDGAVATSGAYERGPHIVDPRTGRPAAGTLSVTVVGPDLGTADAYATAAFGLGADGPAWTARLEGYGAMTILPGEQVLSTPGLLRLRAQSAKRSVKICLRETPERSRLARVASVMAGGPQT
jgi:thiamine biosynthesis lipoprotein